MDDLVLIRGGGDLASGVALRLHRVGMRVVITELAQPLVIRRLVSFAEAIYQGQAQVEEVTSRRAENVSDLKKALNDGVIPVLVDPECTIINHIAEVGDQMKISVLVDGRMTKRPPNIGIDAAPLVVGLGPGFVAGENCHAVIETNRGHFLGRVIWKGSPLVDTGVPEDSGESFRIVYYVLPERGFSNRIGRSVTA